MHVGMSLAWQNPKSQDKTDLEVYQDELRLADRCEELGFGSIWTTERHFTDYQVVPDGLQFLSYMAGRTKSVLLGTMVTVLPWHDPVWIAEKVAQLDNLSNGRVILGIGRGLDKLECEGFRVDVSEARERFGEGARLICTALETGELNGGGRFYPQPRRALRPNPVRPFADRTYAGATSPATFQLLAELGIGIMYLSQEPRGVAEEKFATYRTIFRETNGIEAPPSIYAGFVFCDPDADHAQELGHKWAADYGETMIDHYELFGTHRDTAKGYESYAPMAEFGREFEDQLADGSSETQIVGTPDQCFDKIMEVRDAIKSETFIGIFKYAHMPFRAANASMELFAKEVLPRLKAVKPNQSVKAAPVLAQ